MVSPKNTNKSGRGGAESPPHICGKRKNLSAGGISPGGAKSPHHIFGKRKKIPLESIFLFKIIKADFQGRVNK